MVNFLELFPVLKAIKVRIFYTKNLFVTIKNDKMIPQVNWGVFDTSRPFLSSQLNKKIRPFQVFSLFRITLACENLTGRQGIKKKDREKNWLYGEILGKKCHVESYLILPSFFSMLKSVVYLFDSKPILAPKNQSCKSDFDITFDLLLKFCLKMYRKILFFSSEINPKPNRQGNAKQRKNLEWPKVLM